MEESDEQIVRQAIAGDRRKFDQLVQKYQAAVCGLTYQWTRNFADAQDLSQDAFLQAYQKLNQLREPARFAGWIRGIATNLCRILRAMRPAFSSFCQERSRGAVARVVNRLRWKKGPVHALFVAEQAPIEIG